MLFQGPFCQISTTPSVVPSTFHEPPAYSPPSSPHPSEAPEQPNLPPPPPYTPSASTSQSLVDKPRDVLHFVDPANETLSSISLRYKVPIQALRRVNNLHADHLLAARRMIVIPSEYYKGGVSLSPRPLEGEEEERRKAKIRRWMVACKVAELVLFLFV